MYLNKLSDSQSTFLLHRFDGYPVEGVTLVDTSAPLTAAVVLDTETTGLDTSVDEIIEIAARLIHYDKSTGTICRIGPAFQALQQSSQPLTADIQRITGLTDEMIAGQQIDWNAFASFCADAPLFISHNASFDRPLVDRFSPRTRSACWACSLAHIPWAVWFPVAKQELLTIYHGFFYTGHRALIDVDALLHLLSFPVPDVLNVSYFSTLRSNAQKPFVHVAAAQSPRDRNGLLKNRRYRWNPDQKVWHKTVPIADLDAEQSFLAEKIYPSGLCEAVVTHIPIKDNFKPL